MVATDINNDGRMDLFVANDTVQNFLFVNRGPDKNHKWQFEEMALAGRSWLQRERPAAFGHGRGCRRFEQDGWQDLFVANVDQEMYLGLPEHQERELSGYRACQRRGAVHAHAERLGLRYFDYDNDGAVDLILANGHPDDMIDSYSQQVHYGEPPLLFHQGADGKLVDVSASAGPVFQKAYAARGLAVGDYNNDGALDVLIANNGGAPVLLRNNAAKGRNWLGIQLEGATANRDAIGTRIIWRAGGKPGGV